MSIVLDIMASAVVLGCLFAWIWELRPGARVVLGGAGSVPLAGDRVGVVARSRLFRAVPERRFGGSAGVGRALFAELVGGRHRLVVLASHRLVSLPLASHLDQDALGRKNGIRQ